MWNPPIALRAAERTSVARTHKARPCFVFLRTRRHARLAAALQTTLAQSDPPARGAKAPSEAGL